MNNFAPWNKFSLAFSCSKSLPYSEEQKSETETKRKIKTKHHKPSNAWWKNRSYGYLCSNLCCTTLSSHQQILPISLCICSAENTLGHESAVELWKLSSLVFKHSYKGGKCFPCTSQQKWDLNKQHLEKNVQLTLSMHFKSTTAETSLSEYWLQQKI